MTHPFAGQAAMAAETPPEKRSANKIFERFCMLTMPLLSVICEFAIAVVEKNFGTVPIVPAGVVTVEAANAPARLPAFGVLATTEPGLPVGSALARAAEFVPALTKADAGNPPNVLASP